jgi:type IV fimbrial biogenesis protein FimT/type IV fimbrial biogenesis protein FimU
MDKTTLTPQKKRKNGFTLAELMITIALLSILTAIALPNLNLFLVKMRVDNQVSEMHRLLLTARNISVNTGMNTTVCPLESGVCTSNWDKEISVFTNDSNTVDNKKYDASTERIVKTKESLSSNDKLQFSMDSIIYTPTGRTITATASSFNYCPKDYASVSRGVQVSSTGRVYTSTDSNGDDKDEDRDGNAIVCT